MEPTRKAPYSVYNDGTGPYAMFTCESCGRDYRAQPVLVEEVKETITKSAFGGLPAQHPDRRQRRREPGRQRPLSEHADQRRAREGLGGGEGQLRRVPVLPPGRVHPRLRHGLRVLQGGLAAQRGAPGAGCAAGRRGRRGLHEWHRERVRDPRRDEGRGRPAVRRGRARCRSRGSAAVRAPAAACASCGGALAAGAKFCASCGTPVPSKAFCTGCGKELAPGAKFCANCGQPAGG